MEKFQKADNNIKQEILGVSNELNSFKSEFKEELNKIKKTIDDVENNQEELASEYESQKGKIKEVMNDSKKLFGENQQLNSNINIFTESLYSEKIKLAQLAQYTHSSFMVELSGILCQRGENVIDLTGKVLVAANITG